MPRRFILSPLTILSAVLFLAAGELACGTGLEFVGAMSLAILAIGITYNQLGGLGTIGGVLFASFALNSLVISQFAKVFLFEPADQGLRAPVLTMTVYAVYYLALMVGVFLFAWIRFDLPRPLEPVTSTHSGMMYTVSLIIGTIAVTYITAVGLAHPGVQNTAHGLGRAFSMLLPLSLVLAVDNRIRQTNGESCFGWMVFFPTAVIELSGFLGASRTGFVEPILLIAVTCYFRRFQFKRRHYFTGAFLVVLLFAIVSPYYLWSRGYRNQASIHQEAATMVRLLASAPEHWQQVEQTVAFSQSNSAARGIQYFSSSNTATLERFALIEPDSTVIAATSHYHWGFTSFLWDAESALPHFIYPNRPDMDGAWFRAEVGGLQTSGQESTFATTTIIPDVWGAFGWVSLIAVPLVVVPWLYVLVDSMFDMTRPWGTVAAVTLLFDNVAGGVGHLIVMDMLEIPIYVLLISWFVGWITRHIPTRGDSSLSEKRPILKSAEMPDIAGI